MKNNLKIGAQGIPISIYELYNVPAVAIAGASLKFVGVNSEFARRLRLISFREK